MGPRADFYLGRGIDAIWLGSIAWDGHPEHFERLFKVRTKKQYLNFLNTEIRYREDFTKIEDGWPWPWKNSRLTDFSYAFDKRKVWISNFGSEWFLYGHEPKEEESDEPIIITEEDFKKSLEGPHPCDNEKLVQFPDMSNIQNVTLGKRSGILLFGRKIDV